MLISWRRHGRLRVHAILPILTLGTLTFACSAAPEPVAVRGERHALLPGASALWGDEGEAFDPRGRLMDWSYAGYRFGEAALPTRAPTIDVRDHGARPDDGEDDSQAIVDALEAAGPGDVVHLPAGTYVLRREIDLPSGVVLAGDGPDQTILDIPVSLTDLRGNPGLAGGGNSSYAFGPGIIEATGKDNGKKLADVTADAQRGDTFIALSSTEGLSVGDWVHVDQHDVNGDLIDRLHADLQQSGSGNEGDQGMAHYSRVSALADGGIELERPLPVDIDTAWSPELFLHDPSATEVGVEHLTIRFPETSYPGHFKEQGYNAIEFKGLFHSFVRDVHVINGDYGVSITYSHFVTVQDVVVGTSNERSGHHALNCGHGGDNLFVGFDVQVPFVHDLTVEWETTGNVFTQGKGRALSLDHHRAAPYANLWTELHLGTGQNVWKSGGSSNRGPHTAAYSTFWNLRADQPMALPPADYGPRMTFVGFGTEASSVSSSLDWFFEDVSPEDVHPQNLWLAQRARRIPELPPSPGPDGGPGSDPGDDAGAEPPAGDGDGDGDGEPGSDGPDGPEGDGDDADDDSDGDGDESSDPSDAPEDVRGGCALTSAGAPAPWWMLLGLLAVLSRRVRSTGCKGLTPSRPGSTRGSRPRDSDLPSA